MTVHGIVSHALRSVAASVKDVSFEISYTAKRGFGTVRGTLLAFVKNSEVMPFSDDAADTKVKGKLLTFQAEGEGAWNHPFDPQIGDVFLVEGLGYAAVSVDKKYGDYYNVEVRSC